MTDAAALLRVAVGAAIAAIAVAFAVHVTVRLNDILTILEGMK